MTTEQYQYARSPWNIRVQPRRAVITQAGARRRLTDSLIVRVIASCAYAASLFALVNGVLQLTIVL